MLWYPTVCWLHKLLIKLWSQFKKKIISLSTDAKFNFMHWVKRGQTTLLALILDMVIEFWPGSSLESPLQLLTTDLRWTPHWWSLQRSRHALINSAFTLLAKLVEVGLTGEMLEDSILLHNYVLKLLSNKHVHPIIKIIQLKWITF